MEPEGPDSISVREFGQVDAERNIDNDQAVLIGEGSEEMAAVRCSYQTECEIGDDHLIRRNVLSQTKRLPWFRRNMSGLLPTPSSVSFQLTKTFHEQDSYEDYE